MKKLATLLLTFCLGVGFISQAQAAVVDSHPSLETYKQINVSEQFIPNPILYRYSVTASKNNDFILDKETFEITRAGVPVQTLVLKVFSGSEFKNQIRKLESTEIKDKTVFEVSPKLTVKKGQTLYFQLEAPTEAWKDVASITVKHDKLKTVTIKTKPIQAPKISYVQAKAADKNELYAGEWITMYGSNVNSNTKVFITVGKENKLLESYATQEGSINFKTPAVGVIKDGKYQLYAMNDTKKSNILVVNYKNPSITYPTIEVISPKGGEQFDPNGNITIEGRFTGVVGGTKVIAYLYSETLGNVRSATGEMTTAGTVNIKMGLVKGGTEDGQYKIILCAEGYTGSNEKDLCTSSKPFTVMDISTTDSCTFNRDLTVGSMGNDVSFLQSFLQTKGFLEIFGEDKGYFGVMTKAALAKYQASIGISPADGYFGLITRTKITTSCNIKEVGLEFITNKAWSIPFISSDGKEIPGGAQYSFRFKVTATDQDIYIPIKAARFDIAGGVVFEIVDSSTGEPYSKGLIHTEVLTSNATKVVGTDSGVYDNKGYYLVKAGTSEEFVTNIILRNFEKTGVYSMKLIALEYLKTPNSEDKHNEILFDNLNKTTESDSIYIIQTQTNPVAKSTNIGTQSSSETSYPTMIELESGATHEFVKTIQQFLNSNGYIVNEKIGEPGSKGYESDYFGEKTKQALIKFQKDKGITPAQGYFGPKTRAVMGI